MDRTPPGAGRPGAAEGKDEDVDPAADNASNLASGLPADLSLDDLLPVAYARLHQLAASARRSVGPSPTLNTTALVNELFLKLVASRSLDTSDENRFYALCARTMRNILIDRIRARKAGKRTPPEPATADGLVSDQVESLLAVDDTLKRLAGHSERLVELVECRVFGGYTLAECADIFGVTERTAQRDWQKAKALLAMGMEGAQPEFLG